jgi:hypothetical protein
MPITLMTFAIFVRSDMVVNPGWLQFADTILVLIGVCGITFAMFGRFAENLVVDIPLRVVLAAFGIVVLLHPDENVARVAAAAVFIAAVIGFWRHRLIAPPKGQPVRPTAPAAEPLPSDLRKIETQLE